MAKQIKFEDRMNRLKEIVYNLESDSVEIDEAVKLYEEGLLLSKELQEQLKGFENKINDISKEK